MRENPYQSPMECDAPKAPRALSKAAFRVAALLSVMFFFLGPLDLAVNNREAGLLLVIPAAVCVIAMVGSMPRNV